MKKTLQSLMTAAVFASALTTGFSDSISANSADDNFPLYPELMYGPPDYTDIEDEPPFEPVITEGTIVTTTATTDVSLEGTTPIYDTHPIPEGTTPIYDDTTLGGVTVTTTTEPLMLGGDVPVFSEPGDLNMDGIHDVRDLSLLKQYLLTNQSQGFVGITGDVNSDDSIDKEDVKALIRLLTGKPEDEEDPIITTVPTSSTTFPTTSTVTLYGPPPAY